MASSFEQMRAETTSHQTGTLKHTKNLQYDENVGAEFYKFRD